MRSAYNIVLLEEAWDDFLCIPDEDTAREAIRALLLGATFEEALEVWLEAEEAGGRDRRSEYRELEWSELEDGFEQVVVGRWAIEFRELTSSEREITKIADQRYSNALDATVVVGIRRPGRP